MSLYVGLDVGGTKLMVAAADGDGNILRHVRQATPHELDAGLDLLHQMVQEVRAGAPITAMGAALGGPLDWQTGVVSPLHQPQWRNVQFKALFEARYGCPVYLDVDTNVAALAEWAADHHGFSRLLYITISTGMGGGFVVDGAIYRGAGGAHPEIAHQCIAYRCAHPDRVECECGTKDCLEGLISGNAIRRIYQKPAEELNQEEWSEIAYNLGQGLRNLATIYLPDVIVLGGGVAVGGGEALISEARRVMEEHVKLVAAPEVRLSRLGYGTALRGAVALAITGTPYE